MIVYHGPKEARQKVLEHEWWFEDGGDSRVHKFNVLVTTYEMINLPAAPNEPHLASEHWRCIVVDAATAGEPVPLPRRLHAQGGRGGRLLPAV